MLHWTPKSITDLKEIGRHIELQFSRDLALKKVNQIIDFTEKTLCNNPLSGRILESNPLFSVLIYEGNSIYYCEHPKSRDLYIVYIQARRSRFDGERVSGEEV